jgi:hypothetical protein
VETASPRLIFDPGTRKQGLFSINEENSLQHLSWDVSVLDSQLYSQGEIEDQDREAYNIIRDNLFHMKSKQMAETMHAEGVITGGNKEIYITKILFDTGALHSFLYKS